MSEQSLLIISAAVLVAILLAVVVLRSRRQHVRFEPPAPSASLRRAPGAPSPSPLAPDFLPVQPEPGNLPHDEALEASEPPEHVIEERAAAERGDAGPLTRLKGLGPKAAARLADLGVTRIDQIAAWSEADAARIDAEMGSFRGRIARDRWVEQARLLAGGDIEAYEAQFGKLGG